MINWCVENLDNNAFEWELGDVFSCGCGTIEDFTKEICDVKNEEENPHWEDWMEEVCSGGFRVCRCLECEEWTIFEWAAVGEINK